MPAAAPTRASTSATLAFGPLTIPVQLFTGVEDRTTRFLKRSEYTTDGRPVGKAPIIKDTDPLELVDTINDEVLRCVETEKGLVEITDDEIKATFDLPEGQADILSFLPLHVMGAGAYMPETLMQVRPEKGKQRGTFNPAAAKAFTVLMKAMRQEQVFALVQLNLRGQPAYGALLPTGRLYRLMFDDEVREDLPMPEIKASAEDIERARSLIQVDRKPPELTNTFRDKLLAYVQKKADDGQTIDKREPETDNVDALLDDLRAATQEENKG